MNGFENYHLREFAPLTLSVERIGPFQSNLEEFDLTDLDGRPCNFFLLVSQNGRGKTTALELVASLVGMLGQEALHEFPFSALNEDSGRAQLDVRVQVFEDGKIHTAVLTLVAGDIGKETFLKPWSSEDLAKVGADSWRKFGFRRTGFGGFEAVGLADDWVRKFNDWIGSRRGAHLTSFEGDPLSLPTVIYLSAYRDIIPIRTNEQRAISEPGDWNYRVLHTFKVEGGSWRDSLDNVLVWLSWLDDGRYQRAIELINRRVFAGQNKFLKGVRKDPPEAIVVSEENEHRLDRLSSGEKSLVQLFLRIGVHMTRNTILLIDELDVHLHLKWRTRTLYQLKGLAAEFPGLTIIATTHAMEVMSAFAMESKEEGLRKGAQVIESEVDERRAAELSKSVDASK